MEKRSRRRIRDLVALTAIQGLSENEIGCARISMVARNTNVPFKGRIQKRKTYHLQIITFRLQRAAGPYSCAISGCDRRGLMLTRKRFQGRSYRRSRRERWPPESIQAFPIESWRPRKSSLSVT